MKKFKNVFALTTVLLAIIFIWLIPKTIGAKKTQYVRIYTREKDSPIIEKKDTILEKTKDSKIKNRHTKGEREIVQIDTLKGSFSKKDFKISLYSRSRHFYPIVEKPIFDSLAIAVDTASIIN